MQAEIRVYEGLNVSRHVFSQTIFFKLYFSKLYFSKLYYSKLYFSQLYLWKSGNLPFQCSSYTGLWSQLRSWISDVVISASQEIFAFQEIAKPERLRRNSRRHLEFWQLQKVPRTDWKLFLKRFLFGGKSLYWITWNSEKSKTVFTGLTLTGVASPRLHILYEFLAVDSLDVRFRLMEVSD